VLKDQIKKEGSSTTQSMGMPQQQNLDLRNIKKSLSPDEQV